jgi:hypothetical protein
MGGDVVEFVAGLKQRSGGDIGGLTQTLLEAGLDLLAQRAFRGFDGVVDLSLAIQSVRGAVNRCFDYIDSPRSEPDLHASAARPGDEAQPSRRVLGFFW